MKTKITKKTARRTPSKRTAASAETAGGTDLLKIARKIREQLNAADAGPSRMERAMTALDHMVQGAQNMTAADSIIISQYFRDMGGMGEDQIFAGTATFVEEIAWEDQEINRLSKAIDAKHKEAGLGEDETWPDGEGPEDVEELRDAWDSRFLQLRVAILRQYGENEMADLLLNDPDAFQDRVEKGRKLFDEKGLGE